MLKIEKYAAIDIGSNAIRLLIATLVEENGKLIQTKKTSLVRVPIRLGEDVFTKGIISEANKARMLDAMQAFTLLMKTHYVAAYKACATSAMREASNGRDIVKYLYKQTGISINIIDGKDEAAIIALTDLHTLISSNRVYLYVDVGGGSTEFTLYSQGKTIVSKSFKLGTVRLLNEQVKPEMWDNVKHWIKKHTKEYDKISLIGSGGNINSIYKYSGKKVGKPLSYFYLSSYYQNIKNYTYQERIKHFNMNSDRADVVLPATKIYLSAMKWAKAKNMYVPKIGLSDGIIKSLYNEKKAFDVEVVL